MYMLVTYIYDSFFCALNFVKLKLDEIVCFEGFKGRSVALDIFVPEN